MNDDVKVREAEQKELARLLWEYLSGSLPAVSHSHGTLRVVCEDDIARAVRVVLPLRRGSQA